VAGDDYYLVWKGEERVMDGLNELLAVASGKIGAAYGAGKEGVPGEKEGLLGEIEADAAFGVAWGMEDGAGKTGSALFR
jgi:hypothetical protein